MALVTLTTDRMEANVLTVTTSTMLVDEFNRLVQAAFKNDPKLEQVGEEVARRAAEKAVLAALNVLRWRQALGDYVETSYVMDLLGGVSRQTVQQRVASGSLVAIKGDGGRLLFPRWQFSPEAPEKINPTASRIIRRFFDSGVVRPESIISWAATSQPELGGKAPRDVISDPAAADKIMRLVESTLALEQ